MNERQVRALNGLMEQARMPLHPYGDPEDPRELHVALEVAHGVDDGNTYAARLWSPTGLYYFPDSFYLRSDGTVYVYDSEQDKSFKLIRAVWEQRPKYGHTLVAQREPEPLPDLST